MLNHYRSLRGCPPQVYSRWELRKVFDDAQRLGGWVCLSHVSLVAKSVDQPQVTALRIRPQEGRIEAYTPRSRCWTRVSSRHRLIVRHGNYHTFFRVPLMDPVHEGGTTISK